MLDINTLAVDPDRSNEGVWFPFFGARLRIARSSNEEADKMRRRLWVENLETLQKGGDEAEELSGQIELQVMAHCVLRDWEDLGSGGKPLKYSPEAALKYLSDPQFIDFRTFVENVSQNREKYRAEAESEAVETVKGTADS